MPKILVIDDEEMILRLIKNILLQDNHTVITCNNFNNIDENSLKDFDMILQRVNMIYVNFLYAIKDRYFQENRFMKLFLVMMVTVMTIL